MPGEPNDVAVRAKGRLLSLRRSLKIIFLMVSTAHLAGCATYMSNFGPEALASCKDNPEALKAYRAIPVGTPHYMAGGFDKVTGEIKCYSSNNLLDLGRQCKFANDKCTWLLAGDMFLLNRVFYPTVGEPELANVVAPTSSGLASSATAQPTKAAQSPSRNSLSPEAQYAIGNVAGQLLVCALLGGGACNIQPAFGDVPPISPARVQPVPKKPSAGGGAIASGMGRVQLCPDGTYVGGVTCHLAPDGSFVGGAPQIAPDGTYVAGTPRIAPNGSYVGESGAITLCADGSYVAGHCQLTPAGSYVGN